MVAVIREMLYEIRRSVNAFGNVTYRKHNAEIVKTGIFGLEPPPHLGLEVGRLNVRRLLMERFVRNGRLILHPSAFILHLFDSPSPALPRSARPSITVSTNGLLISLRICRDSSQ